MCKIKKIICFIIIIIVSMNFVYSEEINERSAGLAIYLDNKANKNNIKIFEEKISSNRLFKEYFPQIHSLTLSGNLETLISNDNLWNLSIDSDIETITTKSLITHMESVYLDISKLVSNQNIDKIYIAAKETNLIIDKISYSISNTNNNIPEIIQKKIDTIYNPIVDLYNTNIEFKDALTNIEIDLNNVKDYNKSINYIIEILSELNDSQISLLNIIKTNNLKFSSNQLEIIFKNNIDIITEQINTFNNLIEIYNRLEISSFRRFSSTVKIIKITEFLENTLKHQGKHISDLKFNKFRTMVTVFTQIKDSTSKDEVEVDMILSRATIPPVGYRVKRDDTIHLLINSYLGYSLSTEFSHGLTAIVNMELSYGLGDLGSLSLFISPVDLLNPINMYLMGDKDDLDYYDLAILSYGLTFGFEKLPIAIGASYIYNQEKDFFSSIKFFAGFDMPIFKIY